MKSIGSGSSGAPRPGGVATATTTTTATTSIPPRMLPSRESAAAQQQQTQHMEALGRDIHTVDRNKLAKQRQRKGACATCGTRLFKPNGLLSRSRKPEPLTIPGSVLEGRCLACNPLDAMEVAEARNNNNNNSNHNNHHNHNHHHHRAGAAVATARTASVPAARHHHHPPQQGNMSVSPTMMKDSGVPTVLNIDDNATIVSEVTVDQFFHGGGGFSSGDSVSVPETPPIRPQASSGMEDVVMGGGGPLRGHNRPGSRPMMPRAGSGSGGGAGGRAIMRPEPSMGRDIDGGGRPFMQKRQSNGDDEMDRPHTAPSRRPQQQQIQPPPPPGISSSHLAHTASSRRRSQLGTLEEAPSGDMETATRPEDSSARDESESDMQTYDSMRLRNKKISSRLGGGPEPPPPQQQQQQQVSAIRSTPPRDASSRSEASAYAEAQVAAVSRYHHHQQPRVPDEPPPVSRSQPRYSIDQVATLVTQMDRTTNADKRTQVVQTLTECMWDLGAAGKEILLQSNGLDILAKTLWADMTAPTPVAAQATANLLLSLVAEGAEKDETRRVPVLQSGTAEGLMDAWLITMQSLIQNAELQEIGCRIFCCLASASSSFSNNNNNTTDDGSSGGVVEINDGTLSGAVQSVLNAMDTHQEVLGIQEWGIRALYNQCVYSRNAEPNKRTLASATLDSGSSASVVLLRILERFRATDVQVEWACQLYWVLSASKDVSEMLSPAIQPMQEMTRLLHELHTTKDEVQDDHRYTVPVQEAILGALSNFAMMEQNRGQTEDDTETVLFVYDIMRMYETEVGILHESCYLIAALASGGDSLRTDDIVERGGVSILLDMIASFRKDAVAREAALRALVALSIGSDAAKAALRKPSSLLCILQFSGSQKDDLMSQELRCTLLASICAARRPDEEPVEGEVVDHLCFAMNQYPDSERLQDAGCRAIRNLSCFPENHDLLATNKIVKILIDAMCNFRDATSIHVSTCCAFWNLKVDTDIQCIITTLQHHLEHKEVVRMACGCLWSMAESSDGLKDKLAQTDGGVDAISCVLMMHPSDESLLENACGLLTSLTVRSELVEAVVKTTGFANMVDAMRSGNASVALLRSGALFMRNVCLAFPEFANEAASVVPAVVHAVQANMEDAPFQREACNFLWLVATQSNESKSKILAMDGVTMFMSVMEKYSGYQEVEEPALGAFRALTLY